MPRQTRWIPPGGSLVEITNRTIQARHLLKPSRELNEILLGIVGRAQRMTGMKICYLVFMSNHYHMLLDVEDARQLARFTNFVNGEIGREVNRLTGWGAKVWARRYDPILVSEDPSDQVARLAYLVRHGVKEGLVERPQDWIGVHGLGAWLEGEPLAGYWFDRTRESEARRRGKSFDRLAFATPETVHLSPLPCWTRQGLAHQEIVEQTAVLVERAIDAGRAERILAGRPTPSGSKVASGPEALSLFERYATLPPTYRPAHPKRSPRPLFHARRKTTRERLAEARRRFEQDYCTASERFRAGQYTIQFPEGCFPPARPFEAVRKVRGLVVSDSRT